MAFKLVLVLALAVPAAAAFYGKGQSFLGSGMQPEVVARTLSRVEDEWKAQAAVFAECKITADLPGTSIVNCADAPSSFGKSCSTVVGAIIQGSGGDKDVTKEYMTDVCSQRAISGWHQTQCHSLATAVRAAMSADKYQNRQNFNSEKLCSGVWTRFLQEQKERTAEEQKEREAADKQAAEEAAAEKKAAEEELKKQGERKKVEQAQREKEEAVAKEVEAKAKAAEAAARVAQKKAEAEAAGQAAKQKKAEAEAAEEEHTKAKAKVEVVAKAAPKPVVVAVAKPAVKKVQEAPKPVAEPVAPVAAKPAVAAPVAEKKAVEEAPAAPKAAAPTAPKPVAVAAKKA